MSSATLDLVIGTSRDFPLQVYQSDGTTPTTFTGDEPLSAQVWPGDQQPAIFEPAISWISGPSAQFMVSFDDADTASWALGVYRLQCSATVGGRTVVIADLSLNLTAAPGSASALPVYCQVSDMLAYAPWLNQLRDFQSDQTGYAAQRNMARTWLDNVIQRHYRLSAGLNVSVFGSAVPSWGPRRTGGNSLWLQQQLDANTLMTGPPRRVVEITAKYAIMLVLQSQLVATGAKENVYAAKATWFLQECENLAKGMTFELDLNGDGYADVTIEGSLVDVLRGN